MTDAGMQLARAGGGATSGEVERLPGRFSLFSFFYKRRREVIAIQKAVANKPSHEKTKKQEIPTAAEKETIGGNVQNERREKNTAAISMVTVAIAAI